MFSDKEKKTAQSIVENESIMSLLTKVLIEPQQQWTGEVIEKSDEQLGQLVKADVLAQQKILQRFNHLKRIGGIGSPDKSGAKKVPK